MSDRILDFFTEYGAGLAAFDAQRIVRHWGVPGTMLSDEFAATLDDRDAMAAALEQGFPLYRALGLATFVPEVLDHEAITERTHRARIRWTFGDEDGAVMTTGDDEYIVRDDGDALRVYVAIAIDEQEKIAELAAARGVDVADFAPGADA